MLNVIHEAEGGYLLPHKKDAVYCAAEGLRKEWEGDNDGFYYEEPDFTPLQRVLRRRIDELMCEVADGYKSVLDAKAKMLNSQDALDRAREELAAAVAAWPKE